MKRIMIVDDAAFMRASLRQILERNGFEVAEEAENGAEAVKKYSQCSPDLVTMDITMPVMTGLDALKEIIAIDPKAKVVMVSAMGQEVYIRESIINGAKTFIVKPFKEDYVVKTLNRILSI